jgi:diguanylate cyclase (GGDEF)-like protein
VPAGSIQLVVDLSAELELPLTLEELLQRVTVRAAKLVGVGQCSIRLLDASGSRLLVGCRNGAPLHEDATYEFKLGEGLIGWVAKYKRPLRTGRAEADVRFTRRDDQRTALGSYLGVPILHAASCIGVLSVIDPANDTFSEEHEQLLKLIAGLCAPRLELSRQERISRLDSSTGMLSTEALQQVLPPAQDKPRAVLVVDVDRFKLINDQRGHAVGDEVLRGVARVLASSLRIGDAVVRHGADQFLLVLPNVALDPASRIAERLRALIEKTEIDSPTGKLRITVSVGVADGAPGEPLKNLVVRGETALATAKDMGENRVHIERGKPA